MTATAAVLIFIGIVGAIIVVLIESNRKRQQYEQAKKDVMDIVAMIEEYRDFYGFYPIMEKGLDVQPGGTLLNVMTALQTPTGHAFYSYIADFNPEMINFARNFAGRRTLNDMIVDPWGMPYNIAIDTNADGSIDIIEKRFDKDADSLNFSFVMRIYRAVIVWSNGPDKQNDFGFGDDICSWK